MTRILRRFVALAGLLVACGPSSPQDQATETEAVTQEEAPTRWKTRDSPGLSAPQRLLRASMLLRGIRPSLAQLQAVSKDPSAYEGYLKQYLEDPRFLDQVQRWFTE